VRCPYDECGFEGTEEEVLEHVEYCKSFDDPDHDESNRKS
jgi:hypothetical protein